MCAQTQNETQDIDFSPSEKFIQTAKFTKNILFYLHPEQVAQFPEHFLLGLPVAEYISPAHSRSALL